MGNIRGGMNGFLGTIGQPTAQVIDGSLKFNGSSNYFNRTPGSTGNRRKFTVSFWVKRSSVDSSEKFFQQRDDSNGSQQVSIQFNSDNTLRVLDQLSGSNELLKDTTRVFRDISAWYHILVAVDTTSHEAEDRCEIYVNGVRETVFGSSTNYDRNYDTSVNTQVRILIGNSRPNSSATLNSYTTARLSQYYFIDGQALKPKFFGFNDPLTGTWRPKKMREGDVGLNDGTTWSSGIPGNVLSGYPATNGFDGRVDTYVYADNTSTMTWTAPKIISGEKIEIYAYAGNTHPILNVNGQSTGAVVGGTAQQNVWVDVTHLCPGGKLETIQAFGQQISGVDRSSGWSAVRVDGEILTDSALFAAFGTNGFYLPMDNEDDFEKDKSGKGNDFTQNNFSGTSIDPDVQKDSPSGAVFGGRAQTGITTTSSAPANYCTFNPGNNINCTLSEGNLKFVTGGNNSTVWSTMPIPTSGKYCFESTFGGGDMALWLDQEARRENRNTHLTSTALGMFMYYSTGSSDNRFQTNSVSTAMDSSFTTDSSGDVYMFEVDMDAGTVRVRKDDGSDSGLYTMPDALKAAPLFIGFSVTTTWPAVTQTFNFGQKPFKNTPSQGFLPLNSATVRPNKVVPRPDQYVGIVTYSGDNSEYRLLSLNHQPDFTWFKERGNTRSHILSDTVTGITKHLSTDESGAQTSPSYPYVSSVDERGIVLRGGTSSGGNVSGRYYVAYSWKAGGNKNTFNVDDVGYATAAAAGLDGGSITPTGASVGTKQGFSLIKYTGTGSAATLPHGLTQAPEFVVVKNLDSNYNWAVYHKDLTSAAYYLFLNNSDGQSNNFYTFWNSTDPSSTVISLGADSSDSNVNTNKASQSHICYAWHSVPGLQKFGTYIGNGNSDGSYIELGFRPSLVIIKCLEGQNWILHDSVREPFNPVSLQLYPSISNAEYDFSGNAKDLLSNGFKLRGNNAGTNDSDGTTKYIYAAWAEAPASNLFGGQSNAR